MIIDTFPDLLYNKDVPSTQCRYCSPKHIYVSKVHIKLRFPYFLHNTLRKKIRIHKGKWESIFSRLQKISYKITHLSFLHIKKGSSTVFSRPFGAARFFF